MFFHLPKGIIALDIDGTITAEAHRLHPEVIQFFTSLAQQNWQFIFITGRPFQWGTRSLQELPFSYALAVQNGALILEMPTCEVLNKQYLTAAVFSIMEPICQEAQTDFIVYLGWEHDDWCYYRRHGFAPDLLEYMHQRCDALKEKWQAVDDFDALPASTFASLKCFTKGAEQAFRLGHQIESKTQLHAPVNRDPFNPDYFIIQVTHPEANKGSALTHFIQSFSNSGPVIAAGDDYNDLSMLAVAQIKIAMASAPEKIKEIADVIAPPASENGIISGLKRAIDLI